MASAKARGQGISRMLCRSRGLQNNTRARAGLRPWPWASLPPYGSWAFSCWLYQNLANPYPSRSRRYCSFPGLLSLSLASFACCPCFCHCTPSLFYHCQNILLKCKSDHVTLLNTFSVFHSFRKIKWSHGFSESATCCLSRSCTVNSLDSLAFPPSHSHPDAEGFLLFLGHTYAPRVSSHPRTFAPAHLRSAYRALLSDLLKVLT